MSMIELGNHHTQRGQLSSPLRRAIVKYLASHEPTSVADLHQQLQGVVGYSDDAACSLLRKTLFSLAGAGHVHRVTVDDQRLWASGPEPIPQGAATARQVMVLDRSVYQPSPGPAMRPGATDFLRHPSVMLGRRTDYRSSLQ